MTIVSFNTISIACITINLYRYPCFRNISMYNKTPKQCNIIPEEIYIEEETDM